MQNGATMKNGAAEFTTLLSRVRDGSQEAAFELIVQYKDFVFRVVRNQLPHDLRKAFDSEDFAQVAWGSIFRHRSRLDRFNQPDEFKAFLAAVAANKVRMEVRKRCLQQKRNVNRERPLDSTAHGCATKDPTPSQFAMANEWYGQMMENEPEHYRQIIELRRKGYSSREIAEIVGMDEGSVRRALRTILTRSCR